MDLFKSRIAKIADRLKSPDQQERSAAKGALDALRGVTLRDKREAVRAAAGKFPDESPTRPWDHGSVTLVSWVARQPQAELIPELDTVYDALPAYARHYVIVALAKIGTREALQRAIRRYAGDEAVRFGATSPFYPVESSSAPASILFSELLAIERGTEREGGAWRLLLQLAEQGRIEQAVLAASTDEVIAAARRATATWRAALASASSHEDVLTARNDLAVLMDLLGHLEDAQSLAELRAATSLEDCWPLLFALASLVRRRQIVPAHAIELCAISAETRRHLYRRLHALGRQQLFPSRWATIESLAEADMVWWLTHPNELNAVPDEIEVMDRIVVDAPDGPASFVLFRFRKHPPHWAAKDGWMAGLSGPYSDRDPLSPDPPSGTFSCFEPWSAKSPREHFDRITGKGSGS